MPRRDRERVRQCQRKPLQIGGRDKSSHEKLAQFIVMQRVTRRQCLLEPSARLDPSFSDRGPEMTATFTKAPVLWERLTWEEIEALRRYIKSSPVFSA